MNNEKTDKAIIASDREQIEYLRREIQLFLPTHSYFTNKHKNSVFISKKKSTHYARASTAIGRYIAGLREKIIDIKDKHGWL
jgi:hypothetical protein